MNKDSLTLVGEKRLKHLLEVESLMRSLLSEEGVAEVFSSYNVGVELMRILEEVTPG
jgi:hypothetical protein